LGTEAPHVSVVVKNLGDGRGVSIGSDRVYYAASLYKTWVMLELFHQREAGFIDFGEEFIVSDYYSELGLNPGELEVCSRTTIDHAMRRMMRISDNVAANMLLDRAGVTNTNNALRNLGLAVTGVSGGSLPTTAGGTAHLLEAIARGRAVSEGASLEMFALLASESIADRIPALLPPGTVVAHKTGNWETATHDAGIVISPGARYLFVALTDYGYRDDGATPIARLSRAVYDYYNPP
jgi:beta-lactamase class A